MSPVVERGRQQALGVDAEQGEAGAGDQTRRSGRAKPRAMAAPLVIARAARRQVLDRRA